MWFGLLIDFLKGLPREIAKQNVSSYLPLFTHLEILIISLLVVIAVCKCYLKYPLHAHSIKGKMEFGENTKDKANEYYNDKSTTQHVAQYTEVLQPCNKSANSYSGVKV